MEERLNELIKILKERNTVRKILQAKDVKSVYEEEKVAMKEQLESFYEEMQPYIANVEYPVSDVSDVVCSENIVEIYFILIMTGIDDVELFDDWAVPRFRLEKVDEDLQEISKKISEFVCGDCFSWYSEEELLKKIVL